MCYVCAMEDKQERSYAKESTKSKPTGVRFDLEKSEFVKKREKLNTFQKVVDFLLNKYWWENRMPVPTHKEAPPLALKQEMVQEQPKQVTPPPKAFKTLLQYKAEKLELETQEQYDKWLAELNADQNFSQKQKDMIIKYN